MAGEIKFCKICGRQFTARSIRQKTCLNPVCVRKNKYLSEKAYHYKFYKNEGLDLPSEPKKKRKPTRMTVAKWNALPVSERWGLMTLEQISAECARLHISYGKAQTMQLQGTLPEDFGRKEEDNG